MWSIMETFVPDRDALVESAVNTFSTDNYEVPNSEGARGVALRRFEFDVSDPEVNGVANTESSVRALLLRGKATPTTTQLNQTNALASRTRRAVGDASKHTCVWDEGPDVYKGPCPIPRAEDGKYYYTVALKGESNTNARSVSWAAEFIVIRR